MPNHEIARIFDREIINIVDAQWKTLTQLELEYYYAEWRTEQDAKADYAEKQNIRWSKTTIKDLLEEGYRTFLCIPTTSESLFAKIVSEMLKRKLRTWNDIENKLADTPYRIRGHIVTSSVFARQCLYSNQAFLTHKAKELSNRDNLTLQEIGNLLRPENYTDATEYLHQ